ncbi:hypothetical protein BN194_13720 [Lacticaseibacillus paracasei]|nr:hypothetical protein Lpp124_09438 [Lacticaseibacillus paracasei subsp. paracasei CNCM I-4649]CCK22319.1 hypothetical protein BN194_13720 [Lacticaseibacillus paracasei]
MKRFWKILTTIFVLGLVLVGCGKSSSSSSSSQKQTTVKIGVVGADNRVLQAVAKKVKKRALRSRSYSSRITISLTPPCAIMILI